MEVRFYRTASGRSPVHEFVEALSPDIQSDFSAAIYMLHGFKKKTQQTPYKELHIAKKRLKEAS